LACSPGFLIKRAWAIVVFGLPLWVVVIYLMISAVNAQLEHANIRINGRVDRWIRLLLVTPNMHKVHHSREQRETDTNYAKHLLALGSLMSHIHCSGRPQ
jgi:sterol desaturase/sphingolipid hydroxylase (fatty acid hydroxylase superfamily)